GHEDRLGRVRADKRVRAGTPGPGASPARLSPRCPARRQLRPRSARGGPQRHRPQAVVQYPPLRQLRLDTLALQLAASAITPILESTKGETPETAAAARVSRTQQRYGCCVIAQKRSVL